MIYRGDGVAVGGGAVHGGVVHGGAVLGGGGLGGGGFAGGASSGHGAAIHGGAVHGGAIHGGAAYGGAVHGGAAVGGASCCGPAGGLGCGVDTGCGTEMGTGFLASVGTGQGDFIAETTYKYVGIGHGDLAFAVQRRSWAGPLICGLIVVLVLVVLIITIPRTTTTTTSFSPVPRSPPRECTFWGDPHVSTFDGGRPSYYGEGEFWIIKNPRVKIQGRYAGTKYTLGLASTQKVVMTGDFLGGHKIEVEPMELEYGGAIRVDGQAMLQQFGTLSVGAATIVYDDQGELVDQAASIWKRNIVHIDVPGVIHMEVFRWGNYIDLRIRMAPLPEGQDGACGNFNGVAEDDSTAAIFDRVGARLQDNEMAFTRRTPIDFSRWMQEMLRTCPPAAMSAAQAKCSAELPSSATSQLLSACIFDRCFGMNEHALQTAKTFATQQELKDAGLIPQ